MANYEIPETPEFSAEMRQLEPTDAATAELFNGMFSQLVENDSHLQKEINKEKQNKLNSTGDASNTTVVFSEASELKAPTSGSKLSALFGIIAKAISSLISHLADTVSHVTKDERTAWNNKANGTHTHSKSEVGLGNVDNTADSAKSVKYAASAGIAEPKFNNGTLYDVGDDVAIGDQNVTGTLIVQGKNGDGAIEFRNPSGAKLGTSIHTGNIGSQSVNYANSAGSVAWGNVTGKPSTFPPTGHQHNASDIIGLPSGSAEYGTFNLTLADGTIAFKGYNYVKIGKVVFFYGQKLALVEVPYNTKLYGFPFTISDWLSVVMHNYVSAPPPVSMSTADELIWYFESNAMYFLKDANFEKFIVDRPLRMVGYYFTDD